MSITFALFAFPVIEYWETFFFEQKYWETLLEKNVMKMTKLYFLVIEEVCLNLPNDWNAIPSTLLEFYIAHGLGQ